jgi:SRSO17 transposase
MSAASLETTLELWASSLREVKERMRPLFTQDRVAASAYAFLDGLLGPERRKTGWMRAEAAGDKGPWRQQAILGRGRWEADALRDIVRDYALETLADPDAVLVIDETGFLKQGKASCGVARQYTGSAGKVTNCQVGVFVAYVSRHRPGTVSAEALGERSGPACRWPCASGGWLCHQTAACQSDDPVCHRDGRAVRLGGRR